MVAPQAQYGIRAQPGCNDFGFSPWNFIALGQDAEVALQGLGDGLLDGNRHWVRRLG
jgi:hypothetical protein